MPTDSPPDAARGSCTSIVSRTMKLAVTMKMMRSTSTTSTRGVTLIAAIRPSSSLSNSLRDIASGFAAEVGDHGAAGGARAVRDRLEPPAVEVERDHRGDGDEDAHRGGDEGLGDAGHHHRGGGGVGLATRSEAREGLDDADHRAEEPDEGCVRTERAEEREETLEGRTPPGDRTDHRVLHRGGAARRRVERLEQHLGFHPAHARERLARLLPLAGVQQGEEFEHLRRAVAAEEDEPLADDRDRRDGQGDEDPHHPFRADAGEEMEEILGQHPDLRAAESATASTRLPAATRSSRCLAGAIVDRTLALRPVGHQLLSEMRRTMQSDEASLPDVFARLDRDAFLADAARLVEEEVLAQTGVAGFAIRGAYRLVAGLRPGFLAD